MEGNNRKKLKAIYFTGGIVVAAVLIVFVVVLMRERSNAQTVKLESAADERTEKWQEGVISYNGQYYQYNQRIKSYLFLGIDKNGEMTGNETCGGSGGQSDVMFLLVQDKKNEQVSLVAINRNSMAEIDVYDANDKKVGTDVAQICLQHTYGDGGRRSCAHTVDAVERLFYDIPISGYFAMNMDGIAILNDAMGGIEVEVLEDLDDVSKGVHLRKGEKKRLNGREAYVYLRSRDVNKFNSATDRLERHKQYIEALVNRMRQLAGGSKTEALSVYEQIDAYAVTDMSVGDLVYEMRDYTYSGKMLTVPGVMTDGDAFEEYNVDAEGLYEMVIDLFYEPVDAP